MIKEIKYNGFTNSPSDYECLDGDLDITYNLINEDGAVHPVEPYKVIGGISNDNKLAFIHSTAEFKHVVWLSGDGGLTTFRYKNINTVSHTDCSISLPLDNETPVDMKAIGNMILLNTDVNTHYLFWKQELSKYVYLGNEVPMPDMIFALNGHLVNSVFNSSNFTFTTDVSTDDGQWTQLATMNISSEYKQFTVGGTNRFAASTDYIALPESCVVVADTDYQCQIQTDRLTAELYVHLYGRNTTEEDWVEITKSSSHNLSTLKFRAKADYQHISVRLYLYWGLLDSAPSKATGSVIFSKGIKHDTLSAINLVETEESCNQCAAAINKFVSDEGNAKERFIYPFFVRYALRLYDGSYVHVSQPALMLPNTGYVPFVNIAVDNSEVRLFAFAADLMLHVVSGSLTSDWKDIIDGIDIFVSQPIFCYDQSAEYSPRETITRCVRAAYGVSSSICSLVNTSYEEHDLYTEAHASFTMQPYLLQFAPRDNADIMADVASVSQFYKVKSFDYDELIGFTSGFSQITFEKGTLKSLIARNVITEEFTQYSHISGQMHVYNSRMHIFNAVYSLPKITSPDRLNTYVGNGTLAQRDTLQCWVLLKVNGQEYRVRHSVPSVSLNGCRWFFYPDSRAYKAVFYYEYEGLYFVLELSLKRHEFLNGAYCVTDSLKDKFSTKLLSSFNPPGGNDGTVSNPSVIYVSEVNNPFVFRNSSVVQVGAGKVMALASCAKALSEGQFGQFPLYAFTDEGVWALELSAEGKYTARQPITRDVCINHDSITQIDSAVLFVTARGIMQLSSSKSQCITDSIIDSKNTFSIDLLPNLKSILGTETAEQMRYVTFREYLKYCRMIYDYTRQRIIAYNPMQTYAYVYSMKSNLWGFIPSAISQSLNSYPDAFAIIKITDEDGNTTSHIANLSNLENTIDDEAEDSTTADNDKPEAIKGVLVTRPLKLDAPDLLKTVDTVIQRGYFRRGSVRCILYGSRDLFNWHYVYSSADHYLRGFRGTPFKFFRLAILCDLQKDESLFGCTVQFTPRLANQPR